MKIHQNPSLELQLEAEAWTLREQLAPPVRPGARGPAADLAQGTRATRVCLTHAQRRGFQEAPPRPQSWSLLPARPCTCFLGVKAPAQPEPLTPQGSKRLNRPFTQSHLRVPLRDLGPSPGVGTDRGSKVPGRPVHGQAPQLSSNEGTLPRPPGCAFLATDSSSKGW